MKTAFQMLQEALFKARLRQEAIRGAEEIRDRASTPEERVKWDEVVKKLTGETE